jgi:hypothetical protein
MIRFTSYYGHTIYIVPQRVLYVQEGGCGSRGSSVNVRLDTGETVTLSDTVDRVQAAIAEALA